jgi:hypothetical protein
LPQHLLQIISSVRELVQIVAEGGVVTRLLQETIYVLKQFARLPAEKVGHLLY